MSQNLLVIGSSGQARVAIDILEKSDEFRVIGLIDDFRRRGEMVAGYEILGGIPDTAEIILKNAIEGLLIAIGDNATRQEIAERLQNLGIDVPYITAVHPSAVVSTSSRIGCGVLVMANAVVNAGAFVGDHCFLNTGATLDHESVMEEFSSLAPGVHVGGNSMIGRATAVCIGAIVSHKVKIGTNSVVGAGAVVLRDIPSQSLAYGIPAKVIRQRNLNERYL